MTSRMTNMLGRDNAGPAKSKARAGPFPIPLLMRPCKIGISVSVAKYMKAPTIDAKKLAKNELPPTSIDIHSLGTMPLPPSGVPSKNPATRIPADKSGNICFANPQLSAIQSLDSPLLIESRIVKENKDKIEEMRKKSFLKRLLRQ